MKKPDTQKRRPLVLVRDTLAQLSTKQLERAVGGSITGDRCLEPPEITYA